ncbi:MAG: CHAP domain-containing protein, partial [Nanoarchaeota archaeon]|nr:CHAP domain-containing protein [Nanoarchaeota archaeon]
EIGLGFIQQNVEMQKSLIDFQSEIAMNDITRKLEAQASEVEYQRELDKEERGYLRDLDKEERDYLIGLDKEDREFERDKIMQDLKNQPTEKDGLDFQLKKLQILQAQKNLDTSSLKQYDAKTISQVDALAKSFDSSPIVKNYIEVQNKKLSVNKIIEANVGGPGELALVYEFMKALDPTSVVRESEYATAAKSGNIFAGVLAKFNGYWKEEGGFMPDQVKESFRTIIGSKFDVIQTQYDNLYNETSRKINMKTGDGDGSEFLTQYDLERTSDGNNETDLLANLKPLTMGYQNLEQLVTENPEYYDLANSLIEEYSDDEIMQFIDSIQEDIGFNNDLSTSVNYSTLKKVVAKKDGSDGGQCGRFVNSITNLGVGDSYESKMAKMDIKNPTSEQIKPGMVFTMPYKNYGHIGFIVSNNGDGTVTVKDSNYSLDEKIKTHNIAISKIKGVTYA